MDVSTSLMGEIRVLNENRNISVSQINQLDLLPKYHNISQYYDYKKVMIYIFVKVDSITL